MALKCIPNTIAIGSAVECLVGKNHSAPHRLEESWRYGRCLGACDQDPAGRAGRGQQAGFRLGCHGREQIGDKVPETASKDHSETVHFVDQCSGTTVIGQRLGNLELKRIKRVARLRGIVVGYEATNPFREILCGGLDKVALTQGGSDREELLAGLCVIERREHGQAIAKSLMKRTDFEEVHVKEVGSHGV